MGHGNMEGTSDGARIHRFNSHVLGTLSLETIKAKGRTTAAQKNEER